MSTPSRSPLRPQPRLYSFLLAIPLLLTLLNQNATGPVGPGSVPPSPAVSVAPAPPASVIPETIPPRSAPASIEAAPPRPTTSPSTAPTVAAPKPTPDASGHSGSTVDGEFAHLEGVVTDDTGERVLGQSEVVLPELNIQTFSNFEGKYTIRKIPPRARAYEVMVIHPGFEYLYDKKLLDKAKTYHADYKLKRKGF